ELFFYGTFVSAVAIFVRFAWVYPATYLPLVLRALLGEQVAPPREGEVFIIGWCGMRGIVSLAAALALPQTLQDGNAFPERDLIIFLTFVVIAVTLVLQGLTLKPLIRMLKVGRDWSLQEEQQRAQMALGKAAIAAIDAVAAKDGISNELAERIRAEFAEKITLSVPGGLMLRHSGADDARRLRDAAVKAERQELIRLWRENRPGANGAIAAEFVAKSDADGYTILVGSIGVFSINAALFKDLRYQPLRDFAPITLAVTTPNVLIAKPALPPDSVKELVELA